MSTQSKQLAALSFCAASVPCVLFLPRLGWLYAGGAATIVAILVCLASKFAFRPPRWVSIGLLAWNFIAIGATADAICAAFPDGNALIGILLLLLAAYAAEKKRVMRVGAVAVFILFIIYTMLLGFSLPEMQWALNTKITDPRLASAALAPMLCIFLREDKETLPKLWVVGVVALAVFAGAAAASSSDFYTAMKSVSVLGTMERLEPLVSVALTIGGFCLLGLICTVNEKVISEIVPSKKDGFGLINFGFGIVCVYLSRSFGAVVLSIGTAIFWGLIPSAPLLVEIGKKLRKNEKNA